MVNPAGTDTIIYLSSMTTGVYTITGTSEGVEGTVDVTHYPDEPATIVLSPDEAGVPAGADTVFEAVARDQYNNHIDMGGYGSTYGYNLSFSLVDGDGSLGSRYLEDDSLNWKVGYTSYQYSADTSYIRAHYEGNPADTVVLYSAEPGDFDHFMIHVISDSSYVSDGEIEEANWIILEAQDENNIRIYTYDNDDTVELALTGSAAADSQVTWFFPIITFLKEVPPPEGVAGLTAALPPGSFYNGQTVEGIGIANQVAETAQATATDTAGNTGTSAGMTWIPDAVSAFRVQLEGGVTTINAMDTVNVEVAAIDQFGNPTDLGLPLNVVLSANSGLVQFPTGATQLMAAAIVLYPTVVLGAASGLTITVADLSDPSTYGISDPIEVLPAGIADAPVVWGMSVNLASGSILYQVPVQSSVDIKLYNKVGMEVKDLVNGEKAAGYYSESLDALNLSSDIYFVVMKAGDFTKTVKVPVIK
jgi:hypothetical protein